MKCKGGILLKKQSNLSRLLTIAGSYRYLTYASWILSAISALIALVPYYFIWQVMREVLEVAPDFSRAQNLTYNGWMAVMFAVIAVLEHRRADVLPSGRISHCHQFAFAVHEPYRKTPPGICGTFWQR